MSKEYSTNQTQDGAIQIKDGQVVVTNPGPEGVPAEIWPSDQVDIYVDGKLINNKTSVTADNQVVLEAKEVPGERSININIDKKKMQVYLAVEVNPGMKCAVKDIAPVKVMEKVPTDIITVPEAPITFEEVCQALEKKGVVHGIDYEAIREAIDKCTGDPVLVASGTKMVPGRDAYIEACFQDGEYVEKCEDAFRVDNFDYGTIASVEVGVVVARKIPAQPGKAGMDVTGKTIDPPKTRDVELKAGPGVELSEDGREAIAKINGRPQLKGGIAAVVPMLTIDGDVDKNTGNVYFAGDILVTGNVLDAMKVRAGGSIQIMGNAAHCQIEAGGDISIARNAINANLKSGGVKVHLFPIRDSLQTILASIEELLEVLGKFFGDSRVMERPEVIKHGPGALLKIILDTRYPQLSKDLQELDEMFASLAESEQTLFDNSLSLLTGQLKENLSGANPLKFRERGEITALLKEYVKRCQSGLEDIMWALRDKSSISVGYTQHSDLEATGDVIIKGKGCYNTKIVCGGNVIAKEPKSFFRGGQITAEGNVDIYELGSPGGAVTTVEVPANSLVNFTAAYPGVTIKQGTAIKKVGTRVGDL